MKKPTRLQFVWFVALLAFVFTLFGCAPPSYVMIAGSSEFLRAEQFEAQRIRESIPPDLKKRLKKVVAKSQAQAANAALNKQYLAQMPHPQSLLERELLKTVLEWAKEKPPEQRLVLQHRRSTFEGIVNESNDPDVRAEKSWREHPKVQYGAGVVAGAAIGTVPLGPYAADVAIELHALPDGTYHARVGKACGEVISGIIQMALGCSGMTGGVAMTGTGAGAPAGVVVISASFVLAVNGYATTVHGLQEAQRLWKEGPPPDAPAPAPQEQLLKPKTTPKQPATTAPPAQPAPAKPAPQAAPAKPATPTQTVTRNRKTGEVVKAPEGAKPQQAQTPATTEVKPKAKDAPTTVYQSVNKTTGKVEYVGITNDFARREAEHLRASGLPIAELLKGLIRSDAKAVEQALIELNGLGKEGGTLLNKINSIAKTNPSYAQQLKRGYELLKTINYK